MPRINPEGQLTRAERLATVVAVAGAILLHVVVILGWGRLVLWSQEEQKKERLMVIRRVRDITAPPEAPPETRRLAPQPERGEGVEQVPRKTAPPPPPPDPQVREQGPEPPKETELSPEMERDLREQEPKPEPETKQGENAVSVVTDLPAASFIVASAAQQYRGSGTFWVRKGAPTGVYTATFNPVAGFSTPPVQTKELVAKGQIVFIAKYGRSTEVVVESNVPGARVTVFRPDGRTIELTCPARVMLDNLPPGTYTAVFKELRGHLTPSPVPKNLVPGGKLSFFGEYRAIPAARGPGSAPAVETAGEVDPRARPGGGEGGGDRDGSRGGDSPLARRGGTTGGSKTGSRKGVSDGPSDEGWLDRRVQMIVTSYPPTSIEKNFDPIPYPEVIVRRSRFQQGWCQVYLIVRVDDRGEVTSVEIQRPDRELRAQFEPLIRAVESAVRSWDYDNIQAEVHVDVRFYVE